MAEMKNTQGDLALIFRSEFGDRREVIVRISLIVLAGLAANIYGLGWVGSLWIGSYLFSQAFAYVVLSRAFRGQLALPVQIGAVIYLLTTLIYLAFPLALFLFGDPVLSYAGGLGVITLFAFTLWRFEPPSVLLPYDIAIAWLVAAVSLFVFLPEADTLLSQSIITLVTLAACGYYSMALFNIRRTMATLRAAADRATEAQKMEAIGRLSGGIAHDFNNILTVLQGNLELYDEIDDPTERRKLVAEAFVAARRASGLVRQLLTFARRAPLEPSLIEVKSVIEELTSMTSRLLPASITVFPAIPTEATFVRADRDQLMSSLLNLVINARDAMQEQGELTIAVVTVTVSTARPVEGLEPGRYVRFDITDTGPGMPPETLDRALEPFFTTKPVGEGSGLGLPTAKGFAEQSGGLLTIDTGPGGTTVSIYLPGAQPPPT